MPDGPGGAHAYETLLVERHGDVGWLIFDRPDVGNAMDDGGCSTSSRRRGASSTPTTA